MKIETILRKKTLPSNLKKRLCSFKTSFNPVDSPLSRTLNG